LQASKPSDQLNLVHISIEPDFSVESTHIIKDNPVSSFIAAINKVAMLPD
jgi:hypothetical protein